MNLIFSGITLTQQAIYINYFYYLLRTCGRKMASPMSFKPYQVGCLCAASFPTSRLNVWCCHISINRHVGDTYVAVPPQVTIVCMCMDFTQIN